MQLFNDYFVQPFLTVAKSKGYKIEGKSTLNSHNDIRPIFFREISICLRDYWHLYVKKISIDKDVTITYVLNQEGYVLANDIISAEQKVEHDVPS